MHREWCTQGSYQWLTIHPYSLESNAMQKNSLHFEIFTYIALIKSCAKSRNSENGKEIHRKVCEKGLERNLLVASTLISMYANCGLLTNAQVLFDNLPEQDTIIWNTLMSGYVQHGKDDEALRFAKRMLNQGLCLDHVTYLLSIKACGSICSIRTGNELHCQVAIQCHLERDLKIGNALIDMYMKWGLFVKAKEVLGRLPVQDVVSWNALISGYAKQGLPEEALHCYEQMLVEGVFPDAVTMACSLKACGSIIMTGVGCRIHGEIIWKGFLDDDIIVGNALIDMYAKCGMLNKALAVFNKLPQKDAVSWTTLIGGYAQQGHGEEALNCFELMQIHGIIPDAVALLSGLKGCSTTGSSGIGLGIHAEIARRGLMHTELICNALIDMYAKCNLFVNAREVLDMYSTQDVASWNALLSGYTQHGYSEDALCCLREMENEGVASDAITFVCALNACAIERARHTGFEIHAEIERKGLVGNDIFLGNALVGMYAKCGGFFEAWKVLDSLAALDTSTWNVLITGYFEHQLFEDVFDCFALMQQEGTVIPDVVSYVCALKACGMIRAADKGVEFHAEICRRGFLEGDLVIGNVLVAMYCNCGLISMAQEVFENLPSLDSVTWTVLLAGYARQGLNEEALCAFKEMQHKEFIPSVVTYVCVLPACGSLGALDFGLELHAELARKDLLEEDLTAVNALLDMYASCGLLANALETFNGLSVRSIISWSSLISGYGQVGLTNQVYHVLQQMETEGPNPNLVTFISILNACSHAGQVDEGQRYFKAITEYFDLVPRIEHHTCMIDLFGRVGQRDEALWVLKAMPFIPNAVTWHTLLSACRQWHDKELGSQVFNHAIGLDKRDGAALVCAWNIVADPSMLEEAEQDDTFLVQIASSS